MSETTETERDEALGNEVADIETRCEWAEGLAASMEDKYGPFEGDLLEGHVAVRVRDLAETCRRLRGEDDGGRDAMRSVQEYAERHADKWSEEEEDYWMLRLLEEVSELHLATKSEHDGLIPHELRQVASICVNWLRHHYATPPSTDRSGSECPGCGGSGRRA